MITIRYQRNNWLVVHWFLNKWLKDHTFEGIDTTVKQMARRIDLALRIVTDDAIEISFDDVEAEYIRNFWIWIAVGNYRELRYKWDYKNKLPYKVVVK